MNDDFFLGWLAREAKFSVRVVVNPDVKIGYQLRRRVRVCKDKDSTLLLWLIGRDIKTRYVCNKKDILTILKLLAPVYEHIADKDGFDLMQETIDLSIRQMNHEELFEALSKSPLS